MNFGLHTYLPSDFKYITFLRKPEDRIISFYNYVLSMPGNRLHAQVKDLSLLDFTTQINVPDLNNAQARIISGINDNEELMVEKALENIDNNFSFVGLTERYNESLILLKKKFNWSTPYYKTENRTAKRLLLNDIDPETLHIIREFNGADIRLYKEAENRFKNEMKQIGISAFDLIDLEFKNQLFNYHNMISNFKNRMAVNGNRVVNNLKKIF